MSYLKCMTEKVESFIKRMRWKAYFYDNQTEDNGEMKSNFGFKSTTSPPQNQNLTAFENDLYEMLRKIEFRNTKK